MSSKSNKKIKLKKIEHHIVDRTWTYELDVKEVLETFGSEDAFWNAMTSNDEEHDKFIEFMHDGTAGPEDIIEDWLSILHGPEKADEWSKN